MNTQTETMLLQRIDALTKAQLANRLGRHRNTLRSRIAAKGFPQPCADGKWLLSGIIEWEQGNVQH